VITLLVRGSRALPLLLALVALAVPAGAQVVVLEPGAAVRASTVASEVLARRNYLLIDRDTLLGADFQHPGDLVVHDASVRLEGSIAGAVIVINGTLFVRPGARVAGPLVVVGGLVLPSGLAEVGEIVEIPPGYRAVTRTADDTLRVAVRAPPTGPYLVLGGLFGVRHLAYDRVDGFSLSWGPQWRLAGREFGPVMDGWLALRSARAGAGGGVRLQVPLPAGAALTAGAARATQTNEGWIRDDLLNSVGAFVLGRDLRDYYESDAAWATLAADPQTAFARSGFTLSPFVTVRASRDRSLPGSAPWSIAGRRGLDRPNLPVNETTLASLEAGSLVGWQGQSTSFRGQALLEHARERHGPLQFNHWLLSGRWDMQALWNHSLRVSGHAIGTLGQTEAPPQRWSFVGGLGTLPTLPLAALRGDRVAFLHSEYSIPVPAVEFPLVGSPALELVHATGTAWQSGMPMPDWHQNLGVGLRFAVLRTHAWIDPTLERPRLTLLLDLGAP
jgi:hypothetical protein